jgi:hypothetical protein
MFPQTENGTNDKRQLPIVFCKREKKTANFRLFAANGNGKRKFVFLGRQTMNGRVSADLPTYEICQPCSALQFSILQCTRAM